MTRIAQLIGNTFCKTHIIFDQSDPHFLFFCR
jgi:hypothetical protein